MAELNTATQSEAAPLQSKEERKMAELIVDVLNLEDVAPEEIDPAIIMFEDDLGNLTAHVTQEVNARS